MSAPKTVRILIRTTAAKKDAYRALADLHDMSLSAWIIKELDHSVQAAGVVSKPKGRK